MSGIGPIGDVNQYLGLEYSKWRNVVTALALQNPTEYFKQKNILEQKLKKALITQMYTTIYNALNDGHDTTNTAIFTNAELTALTPKYPIQKINEIALDGAKAIEDMMKEIVDILMPDEINKLMAEKLAKTGRATIV